jgi:hypothetical protein
MSGLVSGPAPMTTGDELDIQANGPAARRRPPEITRAIQLYRQGEREESRNCLRRFVAETPGQVEALLWLARVTTDPLESVVAANLASILDPNNEVARRAVAEVHQTHIKADEDKGAAPGMPPAIIAFETGMTLDQARSVIWPFRGINRPIGEALDSKRIKFDDLIWALENAWDERIRNAVKTVLVTRILGTEPKDPAHGLKVVRGSRYTEVQERAAAIDLGKLAGALMTLVYEIMAVAVVVGLLDFLQVFKIPLWAWPLILLSFGLSWLGAKALERRRATVDAYQAGRWGEEKAVEELTYWLDGRWTLVRNFEFPNRSWGDIDLVLVGPRGVAAIEVKACSGRIHNNDDRWLRQSKWGWRKLMTDPGRQATRNAANLHQYLRDEGVEVGWVQAVVIWAGDAELLTTEKPAVPVWGIADIGDQFDKLWTRKPLAEDTIRQAVGVLQAAIPTS